MNKNNPYMGKISSITVGPRQSNFELLRILAMFMVLIVHADYWSLGVPSASDLQTTPISSSIKIIFQFLTVPCVNIFIAISGWFSIKPSIRGLCSFVFQCFFLTSLIYIILIILGHETFNLIGIRNCILLNDGLWFCKAYLGLYLIAPILNIFCEKAHKEQVLGFIISFYIFQTVYGLFGGAPFIMSGYSVFSFVGIYISARYIRLYISGSNNPNKRKQERKLIWGGV